MSASRARLRLLPPAVRLIARGAEQLAPGLGGACSIALLAAAAACAPKLRGLLGALEIILQRCAAIRRAALASRVELPRAAAPLQKPLGASQQLRLCDPGPSFLLPKVHLAQVRGARL